MHPLVIIFAMIMLIGVYTIDHAETAAAEAGEAAIEIDSGRLKGYGAIVGTFRDANPTFTGTASPTAANMPDWFARTQLSHVISGGKVYAYLHADSDAHALAVARRCGGGLTCGLSANGRLRVPGQPTSATLALPSGIPSGVVVLIL